jgi:threonine synthase
MLTMQHALAATEGIYVECSSVLSVAVAAKLVTEGIIKESDTVVCFLTAGGLKDPETSLRYLPDIPLIEPNLEALRDALRQTYGVEIGTAVPV